MKEKYWVSVAMLWVLYNCICTFNWTSWEHINICILSWCLLLHSTIAVVGSVVYFAPLTWNLVTGLSLYPLYPWIVGIPMIDMISSYVGPPVSFLTTQSISSLKPKIIWSVIDDELMFGLLKSFTTMRPYSYDFSYVNWTLFDKLDLFCSIGKWVNKMQETIVSNKNWTNNIFCLICHI